MKKHILLYAVQFFSGQTRVNQIFYYFCKELRPFGADLIIHYFKVLNNYGKLQRIGSCKH